MGGPPYLQILPNPAELQRGYVREGFLWSSKSCRIAEISSLQFGRMSVKSDWILTALAFQAAGYLIRRDAGRTFYGNLGSSAHPLNLTLPSSRGRTGLQYAVRRQPNPVSRRCSYISVRADHYTERGPGLLNKSRIKKEEKANKILQRMDIVSSIRVASVFLQTAFW